MADGKLAVISTLYISNVLACGRYVKEPDSPATGWAPSIAVAANTKQTEMVHE